MRFSSIIAGVFAVATVVQSSPVTKYTPFYDTCGSVIDNTTKVYVLQNRGWGEPHAIGDKHDGYYPMAATFHVDGGYACKFYNEATRGIGSLIGQYYGLTDGNFGDNWAAFYECWKVKEGDEITSDAITTTDPKDVSLASQNAYPPCGYVYSVECGQYSLNESGKGKMQNFEINGESYMPIWYHVSSHCDCRFFSSLTTRFGPELLKQVKGTAEGDFGDKKSASRYDCWIRT
ncbi:hypothetical protein P153DRAFT_383884 [Dothidotthia symphoricarpi CBS 119687]|uniref:Uncharacterized protein n=1 Tax=Dothidotthia symphoricarpi CBS 119687 TaxID=1392245 RepID=A0A6A6AL32_9PLEO|nr:uncharacterized protein P153DRAFT_383884 [Dothidotthia symphoricarpi CBS 119687]KAF2131795.1 hypothetical protein P153DRAFT_383884 [Dothidotthia symphoricarpi CBS 119687]